MYFAGTGGSSGSKVEGELLSSDNEEVRRLTIKPVLLTSTSRTETMYVLGKQNMGMRLLKFTHKVPPVSPICLLSRLDKGQWVWVFGVTLPFLEGNSGLPGSPQLFWGAS